jgi:hypothetical protein
MALSPPYFARGGSVNAVAEFRAFVDAVGLPAVELLAELTSLHNSGDISDIPTSDKNATNVRGLCCRHVGGWAIFYATETMLCRITIIHAASLNPHSFTAVESEAANRLRILQLNGTIK